MAELVRNGPDLAAHGVIRWRRIDLAHVIEQRYGVKLAERSVGDLLRRLGFRVSRCGHDVPNRTPRSRRRIKKLRRPGSRGRARGGQGQAGRGVVAG